MNKNQKEATVALEKIEPALEGKEAHLTYRVRQHEKILELNISEWKPDGIKKSGFYFSAFSKIKKNLKMIADGLSLEQINQGRSDANKIKSIELIIRQANTYITICENFLKLKTEGIVPKDKLHIDPMNDLSNTRYYAYFLYYPKSEKEALIGRAVLSIDSFHGVHFTNTGLDDSRNYLGTYDAYMDMADGIIVFNLTCSDKGRQLHIKVYCRNKDQELRVGEFTTYENNKIQSGTILIEMAPKSVKNPKPESFSFIKNSSKYKTLRKEIIDFFSLKNENFFLVPNEVKSYEELEEYLKKKTTHEDRMSWFLEKYTPEIFLASPSESSIMGDKMYIENIAADITKSFPKIKPIFKKGDEGFGDNNSLAPIEGLNELKTKRFFVLFLEKTSNLSFSLIQLGWALTCCKVVVLVYKEGEVSERILKFKDNILKTIPYKSSVAKNWTRDIAPKLNKIILTHLPKRFGGSMK